MSRLRHAAVMTALAVTGGLLVPQASAAAPRAAEPDLIQVRGTIQVLAGEGGEPDLYSLRLPSGLTVPLRDFTADPDALFVGTLEAPGVGSGKVLASSLRTEALGRAARSRSALAVHQSRVVSQKSAAGPTTHTTYVAKLTNLGAFTMTDDQLLQTVDASQQYWIRETSGAIPSWTRSPAVSAVATAPTSTATGCGLGNGGADFDAVFQHVSATAFPGVDFTTSSNHLVMVVPNACVNTVASGRGRRGVSFASGGPVILLEQSGATTLDVLNHEFGHNLGFEHANNSRVEYGDVYQVMGAAPDGFVSPALGTVYRWENGVVAAGETVDASDGGSWTLSPRASASGLRSAVFIDPDTGRRSFVDYRDGLGTDAGSYYAVSGAAVPDYGQSYSRGVVVEAENSSAGAMLMDVGGNDGALQAGESWSNQSGSVVVTATAASTIQVTRTQMPALPAGSAAIAGTVAPFQRLTASATVAGATAYRYQWTLNGQPIPEADEAAFVPSLDMVGATLGVQVSGYAVGRNPSTATAAATVSPASWYRQTGTKDYPTLSGKVRVGGVLTASGLDWVSWVGATPAGFAPTYTWLRNGKVISGATRSTYRLTHRDLKTYVQVRETPLAPGFASSQFGTSDSTGKVRIGKLTSPRPKIAGKAKVGKRVKARTAGWTRGTKFRYSWSLNGRKIRGAHSKKLRITRSMKRKKLTVRVVGSRKGFKSAAAKSRKKKVR